MKNTVLAAGLCLVSLYASAQNNTTATARYLEKIRDNDVALTAFFAQMPKGGDLHHHYSGSVYTETYVNRVVANNYYINKKTLWVTKTQTPGSVDFASLKDSLAYYKQQLMQKWSVKDYNGVSYPSDKQFFETFMYFGVTSNDSLAQGLQELKNRAKKENVNYIETMFISIPCRLNFSEVSAYTQRLRDAQARHDDAAAQQLLGELYKWLQTKNIKDTAHKFNAQVAALHNDNRIDDDHFTMRYQNYINRTRDPLEVFKSLVVSFESSNSSKLLGGVNIVAPENDETSMADYWLHMQMYRFCHAKYPDVKYAMHAGELALGMVEPEEMNWHINEAVRTAGASRIGHGVDIAYEKDPYDLLRYMADKKIAVEINLFSNEFILKVKNSRHPVTLYRDFKVPIVISTDDAGVLRTNLIDQYVLLAKRYEEIKYSDIKRYVYNSIEYSFIEEEAVKRKLVKDLDAHFARFEEMISKM